MLISVQVNVAIVLKQVRGSVDISASECCDCFETGAWKS